MAAPISSGYLGDATSGIGQGLAFVLPEGKANTYAMQLAQTHASQLQQLAQQKQQQALKAQQQYETDFKNQTLPKAFAPYDKAIDKAHNDWQAKWAGEYAHTGKNPFSNPDAMAEYNTKVLEPARMSNEVGQNYAKIRAVAETDPTNKYTKTSKQAVIDWEQKLNKGDLSTLNEKMPQLVENPSTIDDLVKTLKPVASTSKTNDGRMETEVKGPDTSNHRAQAFSSLLGDPKWHDVLKNYGYNPELPDFGVYTDPKSPTGKRVWYTNPDFTSHQADLILAAPTDPKNAQILQTIGIHPEDQYAKEKLQHAITDQNAAMGKAVNDVGSRLDASVPSSKESKRVFGDDNLRLATERLGLSEDRLALSEEKAAQAKGKSDAPTVRQDLIERARLGDKDENGIGAGEEIKSIVSANPAFNIGGKQGQLGILLDPKDKNIQHWHIPEKQLSGSNTIRAHTVTLDASKPTTYQAGLNEIMNNITGEHVSLTKAISEHGKGFVPGGKRNPEIKPVQQNPGTLFDVNGTQYNIPAGKENLFLKSFPNAKKLSDLTTHI